MRAGGGGGRVLTVVGGGNAPLLVLESYWATDTATHTRLESGRERFGPSGCEASGSPGQSLRVRGDVGSVWSGMTVLTGHRCLLSGGAGLFSTSRDCCYACRKPDV